MGRKGNRGVRYDIPPIQVMGKRKQRVDTDLC